MQKAKVRLLIESIVLILSIGGLIISIICDSDFFIGFCSSLIGASAVGLCKMYKITRNKEKAVEYEILEKDERVKSIVKESKSIAYNIILILLVCSSLIGYIKGNETVLLFSSFIVLLSTTSYFIITAVLNKIR